MLKLIKDNLLKLKLKRKHYKLMTILFLFVVVGGLFLGVQDVHATNILVEGLTSVLLWVAEIFMALGLFALEYIKAIATYNNFMDAPPVVLGWLMVRDVANMFFVVALLAIAFGTILGLEQYEWKRSLIKLVLAAIFINFSKLILQLIIDASQVFTITFYNAFADSSGENFINMFKLAEIQKMITGGSPKIEPLNKQIFAAGVMMVVMAGIAMVTIWVYLIILIARIVMLWILMVLSPLAFVLQTIPAGKKYADEFWQKFFHHVLVAPVMFFFLWLSFATLGNGNIAAQVGINTSATATAGAGFDVASGIGTSAITTSEGTTWENMSSFAMTIGFLVAGLSFVQGLGVVGGGLTQKATQFGMAVATIASGYAAGRWVAGKGKEAASDYGKLVWGKTGGAVLRSDALQKSFLTRLPANMLSGRSKENRQKALKDLERKQQAQSDRALAGGATGLAGALAPSKKRTVEIEKETEFIKARKADEEKRWGSEATKKMFRDDHNTFAEQKLEGLDKMAATVNVKFENEDASSPLGNLYAKAQEQLKAGEGAKAAATLSELDEELSKDSRFKDVYNNRAKRELDRKASKGTLMIAKELEEQYSGEEAGGEKARKEKLSGFFNLAYEESEKKSLEKGMNDTRRDLMVEQHLRNTKDKREISQLSEEEKDKVFDNLTKDEKAKLHKSIRPQAVFKEFIDKGKFGDLAKIGGEFEEFEGHKDLGKYKTEAEKSKARMLDIARGSTGRASDVAKRGEIIAAHTEFKEFENFDYVRFEKEISEAYGDVKKLRALIKEKEGRDEDTDEEEDVKKQKVRKLGEMMAAFKKAMPESMSGLAGLDTSFEQEEITDKNNIGKFEMAIIAGKTWDEVKSPEQSQETEKEIISSYGRHRGRIMRMNMLASDSAAISDKHSAMGGTIIEGVNEKGETILTYAVNATDGLGENGRSGTGTEQDGKAVRDNYVNNNVLPFVTNTSAKNARALVVMKGTGKSSRFQNQQALRAARMAISTGEGLKTQEDTRVIFGSSVGKTSYDAETGTFEMEEDIRKGLALGFNDMVGTYNRTTSSAEKDKIQKSAKLRLQQMEVKEITRSDGSKIKINDATMTEMNDFINASIIEDVVGQEHEFAKGEKIEKKQIEEKKEIKKPSGGGGGGNNNNNGGGGGGGSNGGGDQKSSDDFDIDEQEPVGGQGPETRSSDDFDIDEQEPVKSRQTRKQRRQAERERAKYKEDFRSGEQQPETETSVPEAPEPKETPSVAKVNAREGKRTGQLNPIKGFPGAQEALNLNNALKQVTEGLKVLSADLAGSFGSLSDTMSSSKNIDEIKKTAKEAGIPSDPSAVADFALAKTIIAAFSRTDDKGRDQQILLSSKISALADGKSKDNLSQLISGGSTLKDADIMKLSRGIAGAITSAEKEKPKV